MTDIEIADAAMRFVIKFGVSGFVFAIVWRVFSWFLTMRKVWDTMQ